tara:strand:+ start:106 stop:549 length:444 start_codon:yes stop_codon:yes gene_type:complete
MSRTISYKGTLPMGEQDRIRLKTNTGKTGYKINKFQIISTAPGANDAETVVQIFKKDQTGSIGPTIDFTNADLLAVAYYKDGAGANQDGDVVIIFDNEPFNQDIFVTAADGSSATIPFNYYIELEAMSITDLEATMLTLKNLRTISS